jgi:hypothetical protein
MTMPDLTETKPFGASCVGLILLGTSYVAGADGWHLAALPLLGMLAYCLFFSHDIDVASAFGRKSILPRVRDPDFADIDYFQAGPDLLICQGGKSLVDERSNQANAEAMGYKKRSRRAISTSGREHSESTILIGTQG